MDQIRQKTKSEKFWGGGGGLQCPKIAQLFGELALVIRLHLASLEIFAGERLFISNTDFWYILGLLKVNYGKESFISRMSSKISLVTARMLQSLDNRQYMQHLTLSCFFLNLVTVSYIFNIIYPYISCI